MGTREEVEERALPFRQGDEVLVEIVEPHMYDVDDAVAKIDGYIISIAGAAPYVGEKRMVRIDQVGRTAASALLLDESGEVVSPAPRTPAPQRGRRPARRTPPKAESPDTGAPAPSAPATDEDARRVTSSAARTDGEPQPGGEAGADDIQSKPRRRGRRGGRRRSAAKAQATSE